MQLQQQNNSNKLQEMHELATKAAATGLDMSQAEPSLVLATSLCTPSSTLSEKQSAIPSLAQFVARESLTKDKTTLLTMYGPILTEQALALAKTMQPSPQQVAAKYRREIRRLQQEQWKELRAAGVVPLQHSLKDFVRVIERQLELQQKGENPSPQSVLESVFPADKKKVKSIGASTRRSRWQQAYESDSVRTHPVQIALRETHGTRTLQLRLSAGTFRNSLAVGRCLFQSCDRITRLEHEVELLTADVEHIKQQVQSTKLREELADAGSTSSKEMVLALHGKGKTPTAIAEGLGMKLNTVKSILRRAKQS